MKPVTIKSRDGLDLVSYLTLPAGADGKNLPMVLDVHGGPWARDTWGIATAAAVAAPAVKTNLRRVVVLVSDLLMSAFPPWVMLGAAFRHAA